MRKLWDVMLAAGAILLGLALRLAYLWLAASVVRSVL